MATRPMTIEQICKATTKETLAKRLVMLQGAIASAHTQLQELQGERDAWRSIGTLCALRYGGASGTLRFPDDEVLSVQEEVDDKASIGAEITMDESGMTLVVRRRDDGS